MNILLSSGWIDIEVIDDQHIKVSRLGDAGTEILELELPAVVTVSDGINEPRLPAMRGIMMAKKKKIFRPPETGSYKHPTASSLMRPEIGTQPQFRKKKAPAKYRYDSSLDPAMSWDEGNAAREKGEELIREILDADSLEEAVKSADGIFIATAWKQFEDISNSLSDKVVIDGRYLL